MSPDGPRDVAPAYTALADHLSEFGVPQEAARAPPDSGWRMTRAIARPNTKGGETSDGSST